MGADTITSAERHDLAADIATTWAVWKPATRSRDGRWRYVKADSEQDALRQVKGATLARPWLPTRKWLELPRLRTTKRRTR